MFRMMLVVLMVIFSVSTVFADIPVADGFDFPFDPPNGESKTMGIPLNCSNPTPRWYRSQGFEVAPPPGSACYDSDCDPPGTTLGHTGDDWNYSTGDLGKPIYACANGRVVLLKDYDTEPEDPWKGVVVIRHEAQAGSSFLLPYGTGLDDVVLTVYAHLDLNDLRVEQDQDVVRGELLGFIGETPDGSTGPHLHFEVVVDEGHNPLTGGYSPSCNLALLGKYTWPSEFIEANRSPRVFHTSIDQFRSGQTSGGAAVVEQGSGATDGKIALKQVANTINSWFANTELPFGVPLPKAITRGNEIIVTPSGQGSLVVFRGLVSEGIINWQQAGMLPEEQIDQDVVLWEDYIYCIGGVASTPSCGQPNKVLRGQLDSGGQIINWLELEELPTGLIKHGAEIYNNFLFVFGGYQIDITSCVSDPSNRVFRTNIEPDGTISPWVEMTADSLPVKITHFSSVISGNYLVIIGGSDWTTFPPTPSNHVWSAKINSDGSIDPWQLAGDLSFTLLGADATPLGEYVFVSGGVVDGLPSSSVFRFKVDEDGQLVEYGSIQSLPEAYSGHAMVAVDNSLLVIETENTPLPGNEKTVLRANFVPSGGYISPGEYVGDFDLSLIKDLLYITWGKDTPIGTSATLSYRTSSDQLSWSAWSEPSTPETVVLLTGTARFLEYRVTLTGGANTPSVNDITLFFKDDHSGITSIGDGVTVSQPALTVTFDKVTAGGPTVLQTPPAMQCPTGYRKIRSLDIITSAAFLGQVRLDVGFDKYVFQDPSNARLFHLNNEGECEDITDFVDLDNSIIRGRASSLSPFFVVEYDGVTGIGDKPVVSPSTLSVSCYPNPFNPRTTIRFTVPSKTDATVSIYDASGRLVTTVYHGPAVVGVNEVSWDGRSNTGSLAASGVYFCKVVTPQQTATGKLVLLK